jgi:hypothetical protein
MVGKSMQRAFAWEGDVAVEVRERQPLRICYLGRPLGKESSYMKEVRDQQIWKAPIMFVPVTLESLQRKHGEK